MNVRYARNARIVAIQIAPLLATHLVVVIVVRPHRVPCALHCVVDATVREESELVRGMGEAFLVLRGRGHEASLIRGGDEG